MTRKPDQTQTDTAAPLDEAALDAASGGLYFEDSVRTLRDTGKVAGDGSVMPVFGDGSVRPVKG